MAGWKKTSLDRGQFVLSEETDTFLENAEEHYKINGTFSDGNSQNFKIEDNKLIYLGGNCCVVVNAVSDLKADKVCKITYLFYISGVLADPNGTPSDFTHAKAIRNISTANLIRLNKFDSMEIYAKSDTAGTTITVKNLRVVPLATKI